MQYPTIKKVERLIKKPIINYYLVEITTIINRLLITVKEKYNVWNNIKLVLFFGSLLLKFN